MNYAYGIIMAHEGTATRIMDGQDCDFTAYEDYFADQTRKTAVRMSALGIVALALYLGAFALGRPGTRELRLACAAYGGAILFTAIMALLLARGRLTESRMRAVIVSGNLAIIPLVAHKALSGAPLYEILLIIVVFMFGVVLTAPLVRTATFLVPNIALNAAIIALIGVRNGGTGPALDFAFGSLTLSAFLVVILKSARAAAMRAHGMAAQNWRLSTIDGLSGLLNRRAWLSRAEARYARATLANAGVAFFMIDIDRFKAINDTLGHAGGDEVIRAVSRAIRDATREPDLVGRLGGEEFGVYLEDIDYENARAIAERIRATVASAAIPHGNKTVTVTVSVGFAIGPGGSLDSLVKAGDDCLYSAKIAGRNRVVGNLYPAHALSVQLPLQILWREEFGSGSPEIDEDHRALIESINRLFSEAWSTSDADALFEGLSGAIELIAAHFAAEERVLERIDYPDLERHRAIHAVALETAKNIAESVPRGSGTSIDAVYTLYKEIVLGHMLEEDARFFPFIKSHRESGSEGIDRSVQYPPYLDGDA